MENYRIYVSVKGRGYILAATVYNKDQIDKIAKHYSSEIYEKILVIRHDFDMNYDELYDLIYNNLTRKRRI